MSRLLIYLIVMFSQSVTASQYTDLIYQKSEDLASALRFINTPEDKIEKLSGMVKGKLADNAQLNFSNTLIEARETRDVELFMNLVNKESFESPHEMLNKTIDQIRDGSYVYGNSGYKYFVTSEPVPDLVKNRFYSNNINKPTIALVFHHYHPSNGALIGSPAYLIEAGNNYQIVLPVKSHKSGHNNAPKPTQ